MKKKNIKSTTDIQRGHQITHSDVTFYSGIALTILSFVFAVINCAFPKSIGLRVVFIVVIILWFLAITVTFWDYVKIRATTKDFNRIQLSEKLSASTLLAQKRANEAKARSILQITYGHVPEWHPTNFYDNVLVYDVHEQLRTILIEMRDAVLSMSDETDSDMVTVDLVYCYPDNNYDGNLPVSSEQAGMWRVITSGEMSCLNYKLHDFLGSRESFFFQLDKDSYCFHNDKKNIDRYYIPSGKDHEYESAGSVVGMAINVKNDTPEKVLVKAILTIITYGWNLCKQDNGIEEKDFGDLFKLHVLNGYKSLLESELTQMYIRHMVRDNKMCPLTGITISGTDNVSKEQPQPPFRCQLNPGGEKAGCPLKKNACRCFKNGNATKFLRH